MTKTTLSVPDIHCPSCEKLIKASLADLPGIQSVDVSLEKKTVEINYNDSAISGKALISAIQEGTGYVVEKKNNEGNQYQPLEQQRSLLP